MSQPRDGGFATCTPADTCHTARPDRRLQGIEAVVERHQGAPAEGDDDRLFLRCQNAGPRRLRSGRQIGDRGPLLPFRDGFLIDPVTPRPRPQALLTTISLDGPPLSSWRNHGEFGPSCLPPLPRKDGTIKARDQTVRCLAPTSSAVPGAGASGKPETDQLRPPDQGGHEECVSLQNPEANDTWVEAASSMCCFRAACCRIGGWTMRVGPVAIPQV